MDSFLIVPLSRGMEAKVSPEDFERVAQSKWHAQPNKIGKFYARSWRYDTGSKLHVLLHVFIMGVTNCDHLDGDGLNCTRWNLRIPPTRGHNMANQPARSGTGFKGVYHYPEYSNRFIARIGKPNNGGTLNLGMFDDPEEAARSVDAKAIEFWGPFARLNFPLT